MPLGGKPLIVMAMEAEAAPVRSALNLETKGEKLHPSFSSEIWENNRVCLVLNGEDRRYGVDSIASQPAAIASLLARSKNTTRSVRCIRKWKLPSS